jgi:class 3 adenylate cyclase
LTGLSLWLSGPRFAVTAAVIPAYIAACSLFFTRRTTLIATSLAVAGAGATFGLADGYARPVARFVFVLGVTVPTVSVIARFVSSLETLARSERALHTQVELAKVELEARVTDQVDEIDRLGRLRRFLSPQVADTVVSNGAEDLLATHRRQIAVIFIDLRGFTSFSAVAEPEDVIEVLTEFYDAVGRIVKRLDATVGGFSGDGVMAYFNDPVPCDDPAARALDMATSLRLPMADLGERWSQRGYRIGYGVGIAYGYATLGTIGFEERSDYTPIGSVVNLASRLCDEAVNGEILLDGRAHDAVHAQVAAEPVALELKGFNGVVTAYRVTI